MIDNIPLPVQYGQPMPEIPDGASVYILDFSYDRETLTALYGRSAFLLVLDHHKTARETLEGLAFAKFDMEKSGAVLAWEFFHPDKPMPLLFQYVQDRDLWQWRLPNSREISAYLRMQPFDFELWKVMTSECEGSKGVPDYWIGGGSLVLAAQQQHVNALCDKAVIVDVGGYLVPAVNSPLFQSEIGEELCRRNPSCEFSAIWFYTDRETEVWSLRSRNGFDVSAVAKAMGGGGHPAAAGFTIKHQPKGA